MRKFDINFKNEKDCQFIQVRFTSEKARKEAETKCINNGILTGKYKRFYTDEWQCILQEEYEVISALYNYSIKYWN